MLFLFYNLDYRLGWREDTYPFSLNKLCDRESWLAGRSQRFWKKGLISALLTAQLDLFPFIRNTFIKYILIVISRDDQSRKSISQVGGQLSIHALHYFLSIRYQLNILIQFKWHVSNSKNSILRFWAKYLFWTTIHYSKEDNGTNSLSKYRIKIIIFWINCLQY